MSELPHPYLVLPARRAPWWRRPLRRIGTTLVVAGALLLAYGATVYAWRDPFTDLWARWKQEQLASAYADNIEAERAALLAGLDAEQAADARLLQRAVARAATAMGAGLELGRPIGRIRLESLGVDVVVVNGTREGTDLSKGPGRYPETSLPGLGQTTAIAGHRTTFGAPFRHIDSLRPGDPIVLELPYGVFTYEVTGARIVAENDWSIVRDRGFDAVVLSACHPLFRATERYVVTGRLVRVDVPGYGSYEPGGRS